MENIFRIADELREVAETTQKITLIEFDFRWGAISTVNAKIVSLRVVDKKTLVLFVKKKGNAKFEKIVLRDNFAIFKGWETPKLSSPCETRFDTAKLFEAFDSISCKKIAEKSVRTFSAA